MPTRWIPLCLCLALIACDASPTDAELEPDPVDPVGPVDLSADPDGDGVSTGDELAGYTILVDETGVWDPVNGRIDDPRTVRLVITDPNTPDSDGDGLSDWDERTWATDGTRSDTDGDGLSDRDEINRWGTSPTSVDTDGDATGGIESGTITPLADLFDGAELKLTMVDGVAMAGLDATSPLLVDTDGDGASDYYEWLSPTRNGVVPERPTFQIGITPGTQIALDLDVEWGESFENVQSYQTIRHDSRTDAITRHGSAAGGFYAEMEEWVGVKVSTSIDISPFSGSVGADVGVEVYGGLDLTAGGHGEFTTATGDAHRTAGRTTLDQVEEDGRFRNQRVNGGRIAATFDVVNTGDLAFRLTDLAVGVTRYDRAAGVSRPLTTLHAATADVTLGRGETATLFFEDDDLPADRAIGALADPNSLSFTPVAYGIERSEGVDLDYADEDILLRTAVLEVRYADGDSQTYWRASDIRRDASGEPMGLTVREMLAEAGISAESTLTPYGAYTFEIDGIPTEEWEGEPEPLEYASEDRWLKSGWFILVQRENSPGEVEGDLLDVELRAGDRALVTQITDLDRDGISSWREAKIGTSDELIDSDGDGRSDVFELNHTQIISYGIDGPVESGSDPGASDTDGDGLADSYEIGFCQPFLSVCLDPSDPDWDDDGLLDGDPREFNEWYIPNYYAPPQITCVPTTINTVDADGFPLDCLGVDVQVTDRQFDITELDVEFHRFPWYRWEEGLLNGQLVRFTVEVPGSQIDVQRTLPVGATGLIQWSEIMSPEAQTAFADPATCTPAPTSLGSNAPPLLHPSGFVRITARDWEGDSTTATCQWGGPIITEAGP